MDDNNTTKNNTTHSEVIAGSVIPASKEKNSKSTGIIIALCVILALAGTGFGIFGLVQNGQKDDEIKNLKRQAASATTKDTATVDQQPTEDSPAQEPSHSSSSNEQSSPATNESVVTTISSDYIYIPTWGIKLKIPDDAMAISYVLDDKGSSGTFCATAVRKGYQYRPDFADITKHNSGLGCIDRYYVKSDVAKNAGATPIFTSGDYSFYYSHPQAAISTDRTEQESEVDITNNIIQPLLTNISAL